MGEFKGTKGKLKVIEDFHDFRIDEVIVGNYLQLTAKVTKNGRSLMESKATALVMSLAPEMLEALKEMIAFCEFHGYNVSTEINNAKELIKKATE